MGVSDKVARDALKMAGVVAATNNAVATTELPQLCGSLTTWAWSDNFSPIYSV
jgi:3-methyladenine DNA glycosylase Tag